MKHKQIKIKPCKKYPDGVVKIASCYLCGFCHKLRTIDSINYWSCNFFDMRLASKKDCSEIVHPKCKLEDYGTGLSRKVEDGLPVNNELVIIKVANPWADSPSGHFYAIGKYWHGPKDWIYEKSQSGIIPKEKVLSWQPLPGEE